MRALAYLIKVSFLINSAALARAAQTACQATSLTVSAQDEVEHRSVQHSCAHVWHRKLYSIRVFAMSNALRPGNRGDEGAAQPAGSLARDSEAASKGAGRSAILTSQHSCYLPIATIIGSNYKGAVAYLSKC